MMEGLWSIDFTAEAMHGAGVVVFETNRVYGGDDKYYYIGTYSVTHGKLQAIVDVTHFAGSALSIFGPESNFDLVVVGEIASPSFEAIGCRFDNPGKRMTIKFTKRAELP